MANAVYNSYENYLSKDTNNPVKHTSFDLSHIYNCTTHYGAFIPIYIEDCVPSDHFNISNIIKVQALPMSNPIFNNIKVMTWYFFCPYQLLWRKFDKFIQGGRDGTFTATMPFMNVPLEHNTLADYMGLPINDGGTYSVSAFPFACYQRIYRDYFLNQDDQTTSNTNAWFPDDDDEFSLRDGRCVGLGKTGAWADPNTASLDLGYGARSCNFGSRPDLYFVNANLGNTNAPEPASNPMIACDYPYLNFIRFKNWKRDYFTSAMFAPQRGYEQIVPVSGAGTFNGNVTNGSSIVGDSQLDRFGVIQQTYSGTDSSLNAKLISTDTDLSTVQQLGNAALKNIINRLSVSGSVSLSRNLSGFSITDLMLASQIQLWLERNMQVKAQYNEFLRVHFGDAPYDDRLTKPAYIGGTVQSINVSEVLQTSQSADTPQGTAVGHANSLDSQFVGKYTCHEFGLIMGIMCIIPDAFYTTGLHKLWKKESRFDFYFPEFAQLPPEPIYNYEIFAGLNVTDLGIFGYSGRNDNMRHHRSISVSDLRNPSMADFYSWNITREFGSTPTLTSNAFISTCQKMGVCTMPPSYDVDGTNVSLSTVRADHFPTNYTVNPFIVQIGFKITASRPLPYRNEPQTLNLRRG